MNDPTDLACACGRVVLRVHGPPILSATCYCTSCRDAAARFTALPTPEPVLEDDQGTSFVLQRKDRLTCESGADSLSVHRLDPESHTRRVLASCCNTPMFLEFEQGHWVSLYARRWPRDRRPASEMRTMTGDLPLGTALSNDLPNPRTHSLGFYVRLLGAWAQMGFRAPPLSFVPDDGAS